MIENQTNSDTKSKSDDLKESLKLFELDERKYETDSRFDKYKLDKEFIYEIPINKDTTDNILKISRTIRVAVLTISGYEEQQSDDNKKIIFRLVKQPLASSEAIKHFESILKPYGDESNVIGKQKWDDFRIQALADWGAFYKFCMREKASPEHTERTVYRVFQGCLIKVGEITCDNPDNMNKLFGNINKDIEDDNRRNMFE